ncbi:MAG: hypothetical protein ACI90V_005468 [Bacillariaceae sp.]|jgi:hypothetical protein
MYLILGRILIFVLCMKRTVCLASSSPSSSFPPLRIVSLNKNGGNVKYFDLGSTDTTEENNGNYPLRKKINDKKKTASYLTTVIRSTFLPNGFPIKTPPGYLRYSFWSWIQDISTQLRSVLATQRILEGVGVGSSEATALSALFNYLVRDGCGMAAGKEIDFIDRADHCLEGVVISASVYCYVLYLTVPSLLFSRPSIYICCLVSISHRR